MPVRTASWGYKTPEKTTNAGVTIAGPGRSGTLTSFITKNVGGSWSGCMATAMTQIMCYYKYPDKGIGSHCYTNAAYGELRRFWEYSLQLD